MIRLGHPIKVVTKEGPLLLKKGTELMKFWGGRDRKGLRAKWFSCYSPGLPILKIYDNSDHKHYMAKRSPKQGLTTVT